MTDIESPDLARVQDILDGKEKKAVTQTTTRALPMQVLCLGMGRTGTTSLAAALKILGYKPYDFIDRFYRQHMHLWDDAMRAKFFGEGQRWRKEQFDMVTGDFDALLDIPCCLFAEDLISAYPEAKIILNVRDDPDKWLASMQKTLFKVFAWPSWRVLQYTEPTLCGRWFRHVNLIMQVFCEKDENQLCKTKYLLHNENIQKLVPADSLLVYQIGQGWEPICRFLGCPKPSVPFPIGNTPAEFIETHTKLWWVAVYMSARRAVRYSIPMAVVAFAAFLWTKLT